MKTKRGVRQSERVDFRITSDMKQQLFQASELSTSGTATDFLQGLIETVAPAVIDLNQCRITPEQFKAMVAEQIYVLVSPSPSRSVSRSPSPSPEPCEGEDSD